jgi:hypothetical protein
MHSLDDLTNNVSLLVLFNVELKSFSLEFLLHMFVLHDVLQVSLHSVECGIFEYRGYSVAIMVNNQQLTRIFFAVSTFE